VTNILRVRLGVLGMTLLGALAATACGGYGVKRADNPPLQAFAAPPEGASLICMFRGHGPGVSVITPVADNRRLVGATKGASYFCYDAEPGEHVLEVDDAAATLQARAGERYYYYHEYLRGVDKLVRVTDGTAAALTRLSDYTELEDVPQGIAVPSAVALAPARTPLGAVRVATKMPERNSAQTASAKLAPSQSTARAAR